MRNEVCVVKGHKPQSMLSAQRNGSKPASGDRALPVKPHEAASLAEDWLATLRRYFLFLLAAHLIWETLQLPLYTIWLNGSAGEIAFAVIHCTVGDLLIAFSCLVGALILSGDRSWPARRFWVVAALTIIFGVAYTVFSEWLNLVVRKSWAYSDLMPVVPILGTGLSPLIQWIVIPLAGLWWARGAKQLSWLQGQ